MFAEEVIVTIAKSIVSSLSSMVSCEALSVVNRLIKDEIFHRE